MIRTSSIVYSTFPFKWSIQSSNWNFNYWKINLNLIVFDIIIESVYLRKKFIYKNSNFPTKKNHSVCEKIFRNRWQKIGKMIKQNVGIVIGISVDCFFGTVVWEWIRFNGDFLNHVCVQLFMIVLATGIGEMFSYCISPIFNGLKREMG